MPTEDQLNQMALACGYISYNALSGPLAIKIMKLAIAANSANALIEIRNLVAGWEANG